MAKRIMVAFLAVLISFSSILALSSCSIRKDSFKVTFLAGADDAVLYSGQTVQVVKNNAELDPPMFIRRGYNFNGWSIALSQINEDKTIWAMWSQYQFEVTFYGNGGYTDKGEGKIVKTVSSGLDIVDVAPEFKKQGYTLSWDTQLELVSEKCVINAVWTPKQYTLNYLDKDGSALELESTTIKYDSLLEDLPVIADRQEEQKTLRFTHWSNEQGMPYFNGMLWNNDKQEESQYNLYANWTEDEFVIKYDLNGGDAVQTPTSYSSGDVVNINTPKKKGHYFVGWSVDGLPGIHPKFTIDAQSSGDKLLKANWESDCFTFTLDYNGGYALGSTNKVNIFYGQKVGPIKTPIRDNYEFIGWTYGDDPRLINENTLWDIIPTTEMVLKAQYRKIYTLKFSLQARVYDKDLSCVVTDIGDLNKLGITSNADFEQKADTFEIKIKEGETLAEHGINVMPTIDPIEPLINKPNGRGDDYFYNGYWKYTYRNEYDREVLVKVRPDTVFNEENFKQIGEDGIVVIKPSCLSWYTK